MTNCMELKAEATRVNHPLMRQENEIYH